jgi:heptaprenyl diphosphate synthase
MLSLRRPRSAAGVPVNGCFEPVGPNRGWVGAPGSVPVVAPASPLLALDEMAAELVRVEAALRSSIVTEIASHLITAGGKRLRPALAVVAAATRTSLPVTDEVILGGVSVELVQVGSLYHDDVMDEALTRRGVESVNARWGNLRAILAGDFLLAKASEIAASLGVEVAGLLASTIWNAMP